MRKFYLGALFGLVGLGIAGSGGTTVFAADPGGPGDAGANLSTMATPGFIVGNDGTPAAGETIAEFEIAGGALSLDAVPNLHFGKQNVADLIQGALTLTTDNVAVTRNATGYDGNDDKTIKVTDNRGTNAGWNLTAKLGTFTNTKPGFTTEKLTADSATLSDGATAGDNTTGITLSDGNFATTANVMLKAAAGQGAGDTTAKFGTGTVIIPQKKNAAAGTYQATINWSLAATPDPASPSNAGDTGA